MRRIWIVLAGFAVVSISPDSWLNAQSGSNSASLTVSATVTQNCTITTTPVNFGAYSPVGTNATAPLDGVGSVVVTCTKGAAAKVGLSTGANVSGTTRRMSAGATAYLNYELYKDTGRTTVWGDTLDTALDIPAAPSRLPRTFQVYGRVPQAQDATVGNYTDTVLATVNF